MPQRWIMHVDMDAFFCSVERILRPDLEGKQLIVGGGPGDRGVVAAASYEVRTFGVRSGMPLSQAHRLCPNAIFLRGNFYAYKSYSQAISNIFTSFTPDVEQFSLDEAFLDFTGFEWLHPSVIQVGHDIQDKILAETKLPCSVGIGTSKTVAKIASDYDKPKGFVFVEPGKEAEFLKDLPVATMPGIGNTTERVLHRLRIYTLGDLALTPVSTLSRFLGSYGSVLRNRALGIDESAVHSAHGIKSISKSMTLARNTSNQERIFSLYCYLLDKVCSTLRRKGRLARKITVTIRYGNFHTVTRQATLGDYTSNTQVLKTTMTQLLKTHLQYKPVRLVGVGVSDLAFQRSGVPTQQSLWATPAHTQEQTFSRLNQSIDRIRNRHGFHSIESAQTLFMKR